MTASTAGKASGLLSCDVSADGLTIAAGTELQGDDASILYWYESEVLSDEIATHIDACSQGPSQPSSAATRPFLYTLGRHHGSPFLAFSRVACSEYGKPATVRLFGRTSLHLERR